jgi:hypothetical protein
MDSTKGKTDNVLLKKIEGRWVPITANENVNRSTNSSTRRRYLSSDGMNIIYVFKQLMYNVLIYIYI